MLFDAIVLAGGRSSRLEGTPKARLVVGGQTLLERTLAAVTAARRVVVVGPPPEFPPAPGVRYVREDPPFAGPAAATAAGLAELARMAAGGAGPASHASQAPFTLVLACDMPRIHAALPALFAAIERYPRAGGAIAVDRGRQQPLAALYATAALADAVGRLQRAGTLAGLGVFQLVGGLDLVRTDVAEGATDDVDTWADAHRLGAEARHDPTTNETTRSDTMNDRTHEDAALQEWAERVIAALEIEGLDLDINAILGLAGKAAHAVLRPAAPLTTFLVGYAAGQSTAGGVTSQQAVRTATDAALGLARDWEAENPR